MPMGMFTTLSDGDSALSDGQRILIARAVVHQQRLLLIAEAIATLDNVSQAAFQQHLAGLNCTRVVFAHRLNTIRNADWITAMHQRQVA